MSAPHYFSPSQIETFSSCQRKWAFGSMLGMRVPQTKGQALGDEVHKQLENYLQGRPQDFTRESGYIAAAAVEHLPKLDDLDNVKVERSFSLSFKGFLLTGRVDYIFTPPNDIPTIGDHKTTSNIHYAKKDLSQDIQATIYAYDAMVLLQTPKVRLKWGYVQTRKPYITRPIEHVAESAQVVERMKHIVEDHLVPMSRLLHLKKQKGVDVDSGQITTVVQTVTPTPAHCEAFGGCPYRAHCTDIGAGERIRSLMGTPTSGSAGVESLMARLKKSSGDNPPPPPPPPPPAPDPINPPEEEQAPAPTAAELEAKETKPKATRKKAEKAEKSVAKEDGITLYVDCIPVKASDSVALTNACVARAKSIVNEQLGVADYRFEPFAKGAGALVAAVVALVNSGEFGSQLAIDSHTPEGQLLVVPLSELASNIVRGLR